jgi:hypothetical protein
MTWTQLPWDARFIASAVLFAVIAMAFTLFSIERKLDRVVQLLGIIADRQAETNSNLRGINHDTNIIRENTPRIEHRWEYDLTAEVPERP